VAGATGHTGRAVAEELLAAHQPTRVIVRSAEKGADLRARGAEIAVASLNDAAALGGALRGASAAYLLVPPDYVAADLIAAEMVTVRALAEGVRDSTLSHVVFLSSIGAQHATGNGPVRVLHEAEEALRGAGKPLTILRAPYFLENWMAALDAVTGQGVLPSFLPLDLTMEMAATRDIGREAARLLMGPPPSGARIVEFGGPEPITPRQLASDLGIAIGKTVMPVQAPLDQVVPVFTAVGVSENSASTFREMYEAFANGLMRYEYPDAPHSRGSLTPVEVLAPYLAKA